MDQELVAYLSQQFADLRADFRGEMDKRFGETAQQFADLRGDMDKGFADLRGEMNLRFGKVDEELRTVKEEVVTVKEEARLAHVVIEGQRDDIRLVAEGVSAANEKIDAVRMELKEEIGDVKSLVQTSYRDLDRRVKTIESSRKRAGRATPA